MTDPIERRLRAADPLAGDEGGIPASARLDAISETIVAQQLLRTRPRRATLVRSMLLAGALLIATPTIFVVAASFMSEAPRGMGDARAYEAEVAAARAITPIPAGATWPVYLEAAPDQGATYGIGLGTQLVQNTAYCMWLGDWYTAHERGDAAEQATAVGVLEQARTWTTFTDPMTTDEVFRAAHEETIDAAVAGDAPGVLRELQLNCTGAWSPSR